MIKILIQCLLVMSLFGYRLFLERKLSFKNTAVWLITFLLFNAVIYCGLLLNSLVLTLWIFGGIGLVLLLLCFDGIKNIRIRLPHIITLLIVVLFANSLSMVNLVHYDNFSHWAKIIRFISENLSLPGAHDVIIEFTSYPPGSALIPAVLTRVFVFNEPVMLVSQFLLIAASILALFSDIKDTNRLQPQIVLFLAIGVAFVSAKSIGFDTLLVDALMVFMGLGVYGIVKGHRDNFRAMSLSIFLGIFTVIIVKNSAVYFIIPALFQYLYITIKKHKVLKKIVIALIVLSTSFSSMLLWNQHTSSTFTHVSKHSIDSEAYSKILLSKTEAIRDQISIQFIETTLSHKAPATLMIIVSFIVLLVFALLLQRKYRKSIKHTAGVILSLFTYVIIYFVGIYIMFMVSMPTEEALVLAGYERYAMSMGLFIVVITGFTSMHWLDDLYYGTDLQTRTLSSFKSVETKKIYQMSTLVLSLIVIMLFMAESNRIMIQNETLGSNLPKEFVSSMPRSPSKDQSYLIVSSNDDKRIESYYLHVVSEYYLWTNDIVIKDEYYKFSKVEFIELLDSVDTIIVVSHNISFDAMIYDLTGIHLENGHYSSDEIIGLITKS